MSQELAVDISKQVIDSGYLEFFELEIGQGTNNILYFHAGKNELLQDITWASNTYVALPLVMQGIEHKYDGPSSRPSLTIANVESILKSSSAFKTQMTDGTWGATYDDGTEINDTDFVFDDLIGAKLTRRRTLEKYLTSNPIIEFKKDIYIIDRIEERTNAIVSFELASAFDLESVRIPGRIVVGKYCPWKYQGASTEIADLADRRGACVWKKTNQIPHSTGTAASVYATENDEPLLLQSAVEGSTGFATITNHASPGTREVDVFVKLTFPVGHAEEDYPRYFRSRVASNSSPILVSNSVDTSKWQEVRVYTTYSSDSDSKEYILFSDDVRRNSYVLHDNTIWRAVIANTNSSDKTPATSSKYWQRADICGKLLGSCKMRYQAMGINNSNGFNFIPSINLDTNKTLPFGGFPGSKKFR